jgi:uncharacterized protein involved in exopolysaccharide biosynthesis
VAVASVAHAAAPVSRPDERVTEALAAVEGLRQELAAVRQQAGGLEKTVGELRERLAATERELAGLKQALGV